MIKNYGTSLAYIMFYEGNSYLSPRDDAPKIVTIAHLGHPEGEQVLQIATARPKTLLIRYPRKKEKPILCIGSVYSFHERISTHPIDDGTWNKQCDKPTQPLTN